MAPKARMRKCQGRDGEISPYGREGERHLGQGQEGVESR